MKKLMYVTKKQINELIAEFMGYKFTEDGYYLLPIALPQFRNSNHGEWCSQHEVSFAERYWEIIEDALDYNTSWDWLMPVVEKIERLEHINREGRYNVNSINFEENYTCIVTDKGDSIIQAEGETNIKATYKAVVEFIKWYNEQNT